MLDRGWLDPLHFWPIVAWPLTFTAILYALFIFNHALEQQGILYFHLYKGFGRYFVAFYPIASIFDAVIHLYLLYIIGFKYLLFFVLIGPCIFFAKLVFGFMPYAQYIAPLVYVAVALSFLTLLGFIDIGILSKVNVRIFTYLNSLIDA